MATSSNMTKEQAVRLAQNAQRRQKRERNRSRQTEVAITRKAALALGAGAIGLMTRKGIPNAVGGVPWKIPAFAVLTALEVFIDNRLIAAFFGGAADATLATYADRSISNKTAGSWLVSGDETAGELP